MPSITRRRALATAATGSLAALAGCTAGPLGCDRRTELRLDPVDDEDVAAANDRTPSDLHPLSTDLVGAAGADGTTTFHGARWLPPEADIEPFPISPDGGPEHRYVRLDGRYYRIAVERARAATTTVQEFVVRTGPRVDADAQSGDAVAFADLPRHDRRAVLAMLGDYAGVDGDAFDRFAQVWTLGYLQADLVDASLVVPSPAHEYVGYRDWFLQVEPNGTSEDTRVDYDVSLVHLADDEAGFAEAVRSREGVVLASADLTDAQRDIVERAAADGYTECGEWSAALDGVADTLAGVRYVRYDGRWYATNTGDWYDHP